MPIKVWIGVFIVGAAVSFLVWRGERGEGLESTKWPSVPGVMTESSVSKTSDSQGNQNENLIVEYKYAVAGKALQGDRVSIGNTGEAANDIVARYPKGKAVQVFYDPRHPAASVLEPGAEGAEIWAGISIICLLLAIIFLLVAAWRKFKKPRAMVTPVQVA